MLDSNQIAWGVKITLRFFSSINTTTRCRLRCISRTRCAIILCKTFESAVIKQYLHLNIMVISVSKIKNNTDKTNANKSSHQISTGRTTTVSHLHQTWPSFSDHRHLVVYLCHVTIYLSLFDFHHLLPQLYYRYYRDLLFVSLIFTPLCCFNHRYSSLIFRESFKILLMLYVLRIFRK